MKKFEMEENEGKEKNTLDKEALCERLISERKANMEGSVEQILERVKD